MRSLPPRSSVCVAGVQKELATEPLEGSQGDKSSSPAMWVIITQGPCREQSRTPQEAVGMNGRLCQRLEPSAEEHYINTRPRCIFRHSFLLLYGGGFFLPLKVFKGL